MEKPSGVKIWLAQTRANFLILAVFLVLIGAALAHHFFLVERIAGVNFHGGNGPSMNLLDAFLVLIGAVLTHASVNLFNEYSDFKTKIDFNTTRNPFSGGSGMLTSGNTQPRTVLMVAIATLVIGAVIGVYFGIKSHWIIFVFMGLGAFSIVFYTNFLAKILLGEFFAGLTLGSLVVAGAYVALYATPDMPLRMLFSLPVILISIPPGIMTALLLFLNEFPDADADKQGGRFHLVIALGKKKAAILYCILLGLTYIIIIATHFFAHTPFWLYLPLLTLPLAFKAGMGTMKNYESIENMIPLLGVNVQIVLGIDLLLAVGIFVSDLLMH